MNVYEETQLILHKYKIQANKSLGQNFLVDDNVIDEIIQEPEGGAGENIEKVASEIKKYILNSLKELEKIDKKDLVNSRYEKYRRIK